MAAKVTQLFSGAESVHAADALRLAIQARRDAWPYVHLYPPPNAIDVNIIGSALTVDPSTGPIEVVKYTVSAGKRFYLQAVVLGANVTFNPGDALFTVDRNSEIGVTNAQFMPEHGLVNISVQLGSMQQGSWKLQRAREFAAFDIVRIKATNVNLSIGGSNYYVCGLFGYEVPSLDVSPRK